MSEIIDPIQIHPNGITVHIEKAPSTITATTKVAARLAPSRRNMSPRMLRHVRRVRRGGPRRKKPA